MLEGDIKSGDEGDVINFDYNAQEFDNSPKQ
jgi:hypothetical protein